MKLLFLDIDGVINSHTFLYDQGGFARQREIERNDESLDSLEWHLATIDLVDGIPRLQKVIQATKAKVVISSSWRKTMSLKRLIKMFAMFDIEVIDRTPTGSEMEYSCSYSKLSGKMSGTTDYRGQEINEWLTKNKDFYKIDSYAVVDDSLDAGVGHETHFVRTSWFDGIQDEHVEKLIEVLNNVKKKK